MGLEALLRRPELLPLKRSREALSSRHVLRVLPRRAEPGTATADPERPEWKNLSSNVGAQYFWLDRIFSWEADENSFPYQIFHTSRPGALDTSLISSDYINNPRTMNAIYQLGPRLEMAKRWGHETLSGGALTQPAVQ